MKRSLQILAWVLVATWTAEAAHIYVKDEKKTYSGVCTISAGQSEIWHVQPGGELVYVR